MTALVRDHRAAGVGERAVRHVPTGASGQYNEMLVARADLGGDSSIVQIGILQQWARVHLAQTLGEGAQQLTKEGPAMARARMVAGEAEHWQRVGGARGDEVLDALGEVHPLPAPSPADCRGERGHTGGGEGEDWWRAVGIHAKHQARGRAGGGQPVRSSPPSRLPPHPPSPMGSWTWQLEERVAWHRADLALNGTESDGDRRAGRLELVKNRTRGTVRTPGRAASEGCLITKA